MFAQHDRQASRIRRHKRVRSKVAGTYSRPRLAVFRSLRHVYAQVIDDSRGVTLVAASTQDAEVKKVAKKTGNSDAAAAVGKVIAERASQAGVKAVVFDRGGFLYHGRVKALADAARAAGLEL